MLRSFGRRIRNGNVISTAKAGGDGDGGQAVKQSRRNELVLVFEIHVVTCRFPHERSTTPDLVLREDRAYCLIA